MKKWHNLRDSVRLTFRRLSGTDVIPLHVGSPAIRGTHLFQPLLRVGSGKEVTR